MPRPESLEEAKTIFIGTAIKSRNLAEQSTFLNKKTTFRVHETRKGFGLPYRTIAHSTFGMSCGTRFKLGQTYFVAAFDGQRGMTITNGSNAKSLKRLRQMYPNEFANFPDEHKIGPATNIWVALTLLVALVGLILVKRKRDAKTDMARR